MLSEAIKDRWNLQGTLQERQVSAEQKPQAEGMMQHKHQLRSISPNKSLPTSFGVAENMEKCGEKNSVLATMDSDGFVCSCYEAMASGSMP